MPISTQCTELLQDCVQTKNIPSSVYRRITYHQAHILRHTTTTNHYQKPTFEMHFFSLSLLSFLPLTMGIQTIYLGYVENSAQYVPNLISSPSQTTMFHLSPYCQTSPLDPIDTIPTTDTPHQKRIHRLVLRHRHRQRVQPYVHF